MKYEQLLCHLYCGIWMVLPEIKLMLHVFCVFADSRCSFYIQNQQNGTISYPNSSNVYPNKRTCTWLIELQLGYNVQLEVCYS